MRIRRTPAVAVLGLGLAAAATAIALVLSAGSDAARSAAGLEWAGEPEVVRVAELPRDRVLIGEVRNASERTLRIEAEPIELRDRDGRRLESTARFTAAFGHGLYAPDAEIEETPEAEQLRLGEVAEIAPDETAPLTLSWRLREGAGPPVVAALEGASLKLPAAAR